MGHLDRAEQLVCGGAETGLLARGEGKVEELLRPGEVLQVNCDEFSGVRQRRGAVRELCLVEDPSPRGRIATRERIQGPAAERSA